MKLSSLKSNNMKESLLYKQMSEDYRILPNPDKNVLELFIDSFTKHKDEYFAWDETSGTSTRGDFMLKAAVVSQLIKARTNNEHVGIMLPALQTTTLLIIATYMAGKIPVMLNWTVGHKVLSYCADISDLDLIITAGSFYDKVADQIPEDIKSRLMFLEKEVSAISTPMKLKGLLMAKLPRIFINTKIDKTAVVLFTSGSETLPKAVPLTHDNVVSDLWGALQLFEIRVQDIFLSFLPPFHSFGFTVLSILPLITGVKVAYTPNPTNLREVIDVLKHNKATNMMATPTLLKMIMAKASSEELESLRLVISGAESLHEDTKAKFEEMTSSHKSLIIEGYGITECAPIVSLNPDDFQKTNSVGKVIIGLDLKVVNYESFEEIDVKEEGMFVVKGKSVFPGYIDKNVDDPFVEIGGEMYYKTGDLGYIDEDGFLFITGRLKRFIKIGGEMISMPFLEKIINSEYGSDCENCIAVEGNDIAGNPNVVLFTTKELNMSEINAHLREKGVSPIAKIREIRVIDAIPVLGSGKINYRELKEQI
ncbi:MAG: hypothetical protein DRI86_01705 [Bacteroidetes bacterium]|nr:MAG: hypothetical protein DRI86_01705 [Bacteroidota bacterium]